MGRLPLFHTFQVNMFLVRPQHLLNRTYVVVLKPTLRSVRPGLGSQSVSGGLLMMVEARTE